MSRRNIKAYNGKLKGCSSCGADFKKGSIIYSGIMLNQTGMEVVFCNQGCAGGYARLTDTAIAGSDMLFIGKLC